MRAENAGSCGASVADGGPTSSRYWFNVSYLMCHPRTHSDHQVAHSSSLVSVYILLLVRQQSSHKSYYTCENNEVTISSQRYSNDGARLNSVTSLKMCAEFRRRWRVFSVLLIPVRDTWMAWKAPAGRVGICQERRIALGSEVRKPMQ